MEKTIRSVLNTYREVAVLESISSLLHWDMETLMPKGSLSSRSEQLSVLASTIHQRTTNPDFVERVANLDPNQAQDAKLQKQAARLKRDVLRATALDEAFVGRRTRVMVECQDAWKSARKAKDFSIVQGKFSELVAVQKEWAERLRAHPSLKTELGKLSLYEVHLDAFEPGFQSARLRELLEELKVGLPRLLEPALQRQPKKIDSSGFAKSADEQKKLVAEISKALGFNFDRGRLDSSVHPFCGGSPDDVRMTTRYSEDDFSEALYGVIHETGHALYEQNLPAETRHTPCGVAASFGVHESQSRFMENQIARSRGFMRFLSKRTHIDVDLLYRHLNFVERSYIRTESDELTYNLHILLRTEIEEALIEGRIDVKDVPEMWRERFRAYLGLEIPDESLGALQDIHWYGGTFGYFPSYSLGNLLAAELFADFRQEHPKWEEEVEKGEFQTVTSFLNQRVHSKAAFENSPDTMRSALKGRELGAQAFLKYIEEKFLVSKP